PRIRSASERLVWPSNRTIGTSAAPRTEAMTSSPVPSHRRRDPFWNRPATSVRGWTLTSPRTPCGAPTTPTIGSSLLIDFEVDLCSIARRHHFEECADGFRDPSAAADHLSDVRFGDLQVKLGEVAVLLLGHHDRGGVVDERLSDVLHEHAHPSGLRPPARHRVQAGTSPPGIPLRMSSERVVDVGRAPFLNQCRARSASTTSRAGSESGS